MTVSSTAARHMELLGHTGAVRALAAVGDGWVASGGFDRTVRLWEAASGEAGRVLDGHGGAVSALAALPAGLLAVGCDDGAVWIWRWATGVQLSTGLRRLLPPIAIAHRA